ncbi:hypothetical protein J2W32_006500 [Variovorax boronicumulans]|uniref:Helix-turn-helix domain-containing protein n=1 Tax=Variovorax boronicumulans TaxID=436515 RepID=A0AAW8D136_9BURK|nr:hypothetical protein [Variovorax boronicumulans]MDP9897343.1 hypothetical protein [Variovorax boronicumulans]MDQ0057423.1 hypothetical protein [Variovorax boronicumulans]
MTIPTDEELRKREDAFKRERPPDSLGYLTRLKPTLVRFYLDGYSRRSMFDFLVGEGIVSCSRPTFYRWLASHMDFEREAREYTDENRLAMSPERVQVPGESASGGGQSAELRPAAITASASDQAEGQLSKSSTLMTTQTATVESTQAAPPSDSRSSRDASLALLDSALQGIHDKDMGEVAMRALDRLDVRDRGRDRGGGDG